MRKIFSLLLTVCLLITLSNIAYAAGFSDTEKHWAVKEINNWASKGLVSGYSGGTFRPNQRVSRAEFVAMANRAFNIKSSNASVNFADVSPKEWFYNDIVSANAAGYIGGYSDGTFRPNRTITRLEAACVIARLLNLKPDPEGVATFKDSTRVAAWARGNIGAVVDSGLMRGFPDGSFRPDKSITRAEAVVSLSRALQNRGTVPDTVPQVETTTAIAGTVNLDGKTVSSVKINIFKAGSYKILKDTETNNNGYYQVKLEPGEYDITAVTANHVTYKSGVKVIKDKVTTANLTMEEASVLSGTLEKDGNALENTTLLFTTNPTFTTETDNNGNWTVAVVPNREYTCRAYSQGKDEKPKVIEEEIDSGFPGNHNVGTLDAQEGTTSFTGGGGGGSTTPSGETPVVHSVTFKVDRDAGAANVTVEGEDNVFDINLTGYEMTDRFTGLSVNASDNAKKAWVNVSGITRKLEFDNGTASTTVKEILGPLDSGDPGVSLQRLMEFGIDNISVTVESNDGTRTEVTVAVEFPSN